MKSEGYQNANSGGASLAGKQPHKPKVQSKTNKKWIRLATVFLYVLAVSQYIVTAPTSASVAFAFCLGRVGHRFFL
ncbi:hypothetical protein BOX15_Mlig006636g1 [Macrostomum lignano]|uniref:Uncharacterized protein n=1 Tax=Macrostomum lignano TaxID=282301 RepID=A0A267GC48_9PLAT|nr:hypothetical protein BOX15_Mlig006636g1 [Macrostomum lignano]